MGRHKRCLNPPIVDNVADGFPQTACHFVLFSVGIPSLTLQSHYPFFPLRSRPSHFFNPKILLSGIIQILNEYDYYLSHAYPFFRWRPHFLLPHGHLRFYLYTILSVALCCVITTTFSTNRPFTHDLTNCRTATSFNTKR